MFKPPKLKPKIYVDFDYSTFLKLSKEHVREILPNIFQRIKFEAAFFGETSNSFIQNDKNLVTQNIIEKTIIESPSILETEEAPHVSNTDDQHEIIATETTIHVCRLKINEDLVISVSIFLAVFL